MPTRDAQPICAALPVPNSCGTLLHGRPYAPPMPLHRNGPLQLPHEYVNHMGLILRTAFPAGRDPTAHALTDVHTVRRPTSKINSPQGILKLPATMVHLYQEHWSMVLFSLREVDKSKWPNKEQRQLDAAWLLDEDRGLCTLPQYLVALKRADGT
eukprot:9216176-Ditylum_brightwellii.AAC.1